MILSKDFATAHSDHATLVVLYCQRFDTVTLPFVLEG